MLVDRSQMRTQKSERVSIGFMILNRVLEFLLLYPFAFVKEVIAVLDNIKEVIEQENCGG